MSEEFVVFDVNGEEVDWYDPYISHKLLPDGAYEVELGHDFYEVEIPNGGWFEVRERATA